MMQAHIDQYLHELRATLQKIMPLPFGADGRQPVHCLVLAPLAQDLVAAPASQAYVERVFSVCGWLTAGHRNRLSKKSGDACVSETEQRLGVTV